MNNPTLKLLLAFTRRYPLVRGRNFSTAIL